MRLKHLFYCILIFHIWGCTRNKIETEYFDGTDIVKSEKIYLSKDTSAYHWICYYDNSQIEECGLMIDNKKEGIWEAWFKDGVKKFTINYHKGFPDYDLKNRELPYVLVEDSLKPGCESRIKMINFYLEESLLPLSDVIFKDSPNNDYYTYTIIPQDNEPLLFLYETLEEIHIDTLCETNFYRVGITQEELKYTKFYRSDFVELEIINNY